MGGTLPFLLRRGRAQIRVLLAVLAVVVGGTTLAGVAALLLTTGSERARSAALQRAPAEDRTAQVLLTDVDVDADPAGAVGTATRVLTDALAPVPVTTSTW